ncbi:hypothetical protein [Acinetobacter nosocomialis]|uniref:hypothetical protein n=1 Tax=Acinetobacter nosocomialis TaxID=106654 RepID=UPI00280DE8C0|nr:hypothetical protein [Acinetobacter nosocomialis]MDQ9029221.1 hypothetical protein [Acinetobacter nosocomialis]MDQ9046495.1 hypothetical protein [Acinetobacter nosocomialis]MDQ9083909.1 hypothetical protein [Acinetobacter nosocomialis]
MSKDFTNIKSVIEIIGDRKINDFLKAGWVILAVGEGKDEYQDAFIKYSLGHVDADAPTTFY